MIYLYNGIIQIDEVSTTPATWIHFSKIMLKVKHKSTHDMISLQNF